MANHYDAVIIGAGMSGLAAGIRLAMFDKKVLILEKHSISGGLNSYYHRRIPSTKEIFPFDVGLHALTNFAKKGEKRKPLTKLLKQLRIPYEALSLQQQSHSLIRFDKTELKFSNDFELLLSEIASVFPHEIDQFRKFTSYIQEYNEVDLNATYIPTRSVLTQYFKDPLLQEMILAPLLIYGSAWENDMDFSQFVIMFKSIYLEGFSRPVGGVRTIIDLLINKYNSVGGELRYRSEVLEILRDHGQIKGVRLKNDETIYTNKVFSSAGFPETFDLINNPDFNKPQVGPLSFSETILVLENKQIFQKSDETIIFYNQSDNYTYQKPDTLIDTRSAVFCMPDNYERENLNGHGVLRLTYMANYDLWKRLDKEDYKIAKHDVLQAALKTSSLLLNQDVSPIFHDVFTPTTIERYTKHQQGTVYGSTDKMRNGSTPYEGLYIIGTDQGFLGIVGSMLSGISMANLYGLMDE